MESPDRSKRKILKAKKTMPPSCRKQIEVLNKSKNVEALKTAANGNNISSGNQNSSTGVITNKCRHSENDAPLLDFNKNSVCLQKSEVLSQNLVKPLETVDLETGLEYIEGQVVCPYQKSSKTIEFPRKLPTHEAKDSQNISENHSECQANVTRPFFEQHEEDCNLKSICDPPSILSGIVQMPKYTESNTLDDKRIDKVVSHLETNSKSASHGERQNDILILSSGTCFVLVDKRPTLVNSVTSSCDADVLKSEESYRTCHSSISNYKNTDSMWLSSVDTDSNNGHSQKKRMFSENKENVKRLKTAEEINENICVTLEKQTALLEQVKHLIRQEVCSINYKLFDNKLKELTERIGKTQCRNKHEAIAGELVAKVAKLERRIKKAMLPETDSLEPSMSPSDTDRQVANLETLNLNNSPDEGRISVNSEPSNPSGKASEKSDLSQDHDEAVSESNDDVILISVEMPSLTAAVTSNLTDTGKITSGNSNNSPDAETEVMTVKCKELESVIDLTEESVSNCSTESPVSTLEFSMETVSLSKETTPVAQTATQVPKFFEHLPPLPEPPTPHPELVDKIRDTLPPQKTELKVKRILKPRGVALTWNIIKINPKCAPVESYHLFLCQDNASSKPVWKKIGEIKALPLPMACSLSQCLTSNKYYFTIQSKDIFGRYGPFCDIKSISGFSDTLT